MKKYYFKGTNDEINLGDSMTLLIKLKSGKTMKCDTTVDEGTIEDLLKRNSIEVKKIVPVQKRVYRTHGKRGPMPKESNIKVINLNDKEGVNEILNVLTDIISGKY
jgi:hypothetical protein